MTKTQLGSMLDALLHTIQDELAQGGRVQLIGFGTFATGQRAARTGRDPRTGEPLQISAATTVKFTAGKAFKDRVNPVKAGKAKKLTKRNK